MIPSLCSQIKSLKLERRWNHIAIYSSKIIYGSIYIMFLLEILSEHPPNEAATILLLLITMLGIMFAEAYSMIIGIEVHQCAPLTNAQRHQQIRESLPITYGVIIPMIFLVASWSGIIELGQAYVLARIGLIALLFVFGFVSRRFSGGSLARSILTGIIAASIGIFIVNLRNLIETAYTWDKFNGVSEGVQASKVIEF